jgi:hypothetical protein
MFLDDAIGRYASFFFPDERLDVREIIAHAPASGAPRYRLRSRRSFPSPDAVAHSFSGSAAAVVVLLNVQNVRARGATYVAQPRGGTAHCLCCVGVDAAHLFCFDSVPPRRKTISRAALVAGVGAVRAGAAPGAAPGALDAAMDCAMFILEAYAVAPGPTTRR